VRGATVGGHVFFTKGFSAKGAVRLTGSTIRGSIECGKEKAEFLNKWERGIGTSGIALELDGANIALDLNLSGDKIENDHRFISNGTVSLVGTRVGRTFHCKFGKFQQSDKPHDKNAIPRWRHALDLREANTAFLCYPNHCKNVTFQPGKLALDGFRYERISDGATKAEDCIQWIELQYDTGEDFFPQPYLQLAKVLRDEGETKEAKKVLITMERRRPPKSLFDRIWNPLQDITISYGYESWKAFIWLFCLSIFCSIIYEFGYLNGAMTPTDKAAYNAFTTIDGVSDSYPGFHPVLYSIESSQPFVKFGQMDHWQPDPGRLQKEPWKRFGLDWFSWFLSLSGLLSLTHSSQVLLGWFLTTMAVAGLTGLVRRE